MKRHFLDFVALHPGVPQTNTFFALVGEHPELCIPEQETHYFSSEKINQGRDWYEAHFADAEAGMRRGEVSVSYLAAPGVAARLAREYPDTRLYVLIADPVEVLAARYAVSVQTARALPFEEFLERNQLLLEQCKFGKQLGVFFGYYSPVDLMVVTLDDVRKNPANAFKALWEHLEVDKGFVPKILHVFIEEEVRSGWWVRRLRIDRWRAARREKRMLAAQKVFAPVASTLTTKERVLLARYFEDDVAQLSSLLNRDLLAEWQYPSHQKKSGKKQ